jgi:hypothetical protein
MAKKRTSHPYTAHPSLKLMFDWIHGLKAKTGRSLEEWMTHIETEGPATEAARAAWLKKEHGLGTSAAKWLAGRAAGKGLEEESEEAYLEAALGWLETMYEKKSSLRPVHDAVVKLALEVDASARICPCRTMVPIFRTHVIAQIKPSTRTRLDLGLALGELLKRGTKLPKRLVATGGFEKKDRITHCIELSDVSEVDTEVATWLKRAWELDAS